MALLFAYCTTADDLFEEPTKPATRSAASAPHYLDQFEGMPMMIYFPAGLGGASEMYLSRKVYNDPGMPYDLTVFLSPLLPDKHYRQYWYLNKTNIDGCFNIISILADYTNAEIKRIFGTAPDNELLGANHFSQWYINESYYAVWNPDIPYLFWISDPYDFYIRETEIAGYNTIYSCARISTTSYFPAYMGCKYGLNTVYAYENPSNLTNVMISPAEDFRLVSVEYELESDDGTIPRPDFIDEILVHNTSGETQSMPATFTQKATETSNFKNGSSVTVNVSRSMSVGLPKIGLGGSINTSETTSDSWEFGTSESREDSRTYSFNLSVPAYKTYKAQISVAMYDAQATYKATYRGNTSGRDVVLTGKWEGIRAGLISYNIYDNTSGQLLRTVSGVPTSTLTVE